MSTRDIAKHREIYERIHHAILSGEYAIGQRIPTEAELGSWYHASRPTIARALRDLEQEGYLTRRRGAGTFVREFKRAPSRLLGLTVPHTESGILAPVCSEILHRAEKCGYGVLFGGAVARRAEAVPQDIAAFCQPFIERKVAGVFFLPLIPPRSRQDANRQIARRLTEAGISVVLLDRDIQDYPDRSPYDLVGVDNRRNGYVVTQHLLKQGCRRIVFVTIDLPVSTSTARAAGYRDALVDHGITPEPDWVQRWATTYDVDFVRGLLALQADAFVCINDDVARLLMHHLAVLGVRVPDDVRIVGFDDLPFSASLPVPLTSMHQPTRDIGASAMDAMISRLENPQLPARDIMHRCELAVRKSCGCELTSGNPKQVAAG